MNTGKTLLAIAGGLAAGALLGLLFAPDKGSETRKKLFTGGLGDLADDATESFKEGVDKIKSAIPNLRIKGNWNQVKGVLKQQFSNLTDNDLMYLEGKENDLVGRLQAKLGKTKDEIVEIINRASRQFHGASNTGTHY